MKTEVSSNYLSTILWCGASLATSYGLYTYKDPLLDLAAAQGPEIVENAVSNLTSLITSPWLTLPFIGVVGSIALLRLSYPGENEKINEEEFVETTNETASLNSEDIDKLEDETIQQKSLPSAQNPQWFLSIGPIRQLPATLSKGIVKQLGKTQNYFDSWSSNESSWWTTKNAANFGSLIAQGLSVSIRGSKTKSRQTIQGYFDQGWTTKQKIGAYSLGLFALGLTGYTLHANDKLLDSLLTKISMLPLAPELFSFFNKNHDRHFLLAFGSVGSACVVAGLLSSMKSVFTSALSMNAISSSTETIKPKDSKEEQTEFSEDDDEVVLVSIDQQQSLFKTSSSDLKSFSPPSTGSTELSFGSFNKEELLTQLDSLSPQETPSNSQPSSQKGSVRSYTYAGSIQRQKPRSPIGTTNFSDSVKCGTTQIFLEKEPQSSGKSMPLTAFNLLVNNFSQNLKDGNFLQAANTALEEVLKEKGIQPRLVENKLISHEQNQNFKEQKIQGVVDAWKNQFNTCRVYDIKTQKKYLELAVEKLKIQFPKKIEQVDELTPEEKKELQQHAQETGSVVIRFNSKDPLPVKALAYLAQRCEDFWISTEKDEE